LIALVNISSLIGAARQGERMTIIINLHNANVKNEFVITILLYAGFDKFFQAQRKYAQLSVSLN